MYRYFLLLFALSTGMARASELNPTTTNPYEVGIPDSDLTPYGTDGQEEQKRIRHKYNQISQFTRDELAAYTQDKVFDRTYRKRTENAMLDLKENVQFGSLPYALLAMGGTGLLHFARLKALASRPSLKHRSTVWTGALSLLGGGTMSYLFSRIKTYLLKEIGQIVGLLQLDDSTLHRTVRNRQHRLKMKDIGLPRPFGNDEQRLLFPEDVAVAIEKFETEFPPQMFATDADGGAALRTELRPLLQKRMRKLIALHHTLLPASLAAWTLFGANLWAYPGTLVGQEKAHQYGELEAGS